MTDSLVNLILADGTKISFFRTEENEVYVCHEDHCVILPRASGQVTLDLFALLEEFGEVENDDEPE